MRGGAGWQTGEMRKTGVGLLVTCLVVLSGVVAGIFAVRVTADEKAEAEAEPWSPPRGALFGYPTEDSADHSIVRVLLGNIEHTPPGETIRIVGYSFTLRDVATALVDAHQRGVRVQVVLNGHSRDFGATALLLRELGADTGKRSFVVLTGNSARGADGRGVTHQKSWSFSRTGDARYVVMAGSMNLTYLSTEQYTDVYSYVGRRDVWRAFDAVFRRQVRDRPMARPAMTRRLGRDHAYFFPGFAVEREPIYRTLRSLPDQGTRIRVVMHAWHAERGLRLASLLANKARAGARVDVVGGLHIGGGVRARLLAGGVHLHPGVFENGDHIHNKLLLTDYVRDGRRHRLVSTGSDNWGELSLHNDDLVLMIHAKPRLYRQYVAFYERLRARGDAE